MRAKTKSNCKTEEKTKLTLLRGKTTYLIELHFAEKKKCDLSSKIKGLARSAVDSEAF